MVHFLRYILSLLYQSRFYVKFQFELSLIICYLYLQI